MKRIEVTPEFSEWEKGRPDTDAALSLLGEALYERIGAQFVAVKRAHAERNSLTAPVFPHVAQVLARLEQAGIATCVMTSAHKDFCEQMFEAKAELHALRGRLVYRELYQNGKPAPDGLLSVAKLYGHRLENLVYVGDAASDQSCARAAGSAFIQHNGKSLFESEYFMNDHRDIFGLIERIGAARGHPVRAVAYDMDGTLVDTTDIQTAAWKHAAETVAL